MLVPQDGNQTEPRWLIDTGVVSEVVTSFARGQSELGIWSRVWESNQRVR